MGSNSCFSQLIADVFPSWCCGSMYLSAHTAVHTEDLFSVQLISSSCLLRNFNLPVQDLLRRALWENNNRDNWRVL
ncbi:hypothetical protein CRENBAI_023308 [Crenichthys baileyi]|uniref:Uncharacterized protein n=1 Tax=Crenichthys baileyi TaxID=28760 RepID=A0AAV9R7V1_9TELE